jgi:DNA-directed RNA polymerase I subunit RPA1
MSNVSNVFKIKSFKGIQKAMVSKDRSDKPCVQTMGSNLADINEFYELVDLKNVQCNDIYHILQHIGVEAARKAIVTEVANVFNVYGISVDFRHLSLVADYMVTMRYYIC